MTFTLPPKKNRPHFSDDIVRGSSRNTKSGHHVTFQIGTALAGKCGFNENDKVECHFGDTGTPDAGDCLIIPGVEGLKLKLNSNRYTVVVSRLPENIQTFPMADLEVVHANNEGLRVKLPA